MLRHTLAADRHLRLLEEVDADELFAVVDANRGYLGRWLPWVETTRESRDSLHYIRTTRERFAANEGLDLTVIQDAAIVGMVGIGPVDWSNRSAAIGYWLGEDAQGKGTMTAAVSALIEHAFASLDLNRIEIRVAVDNSRSRAIPERLGFREEGLLRQAERHGDEYADVVVYSMLAHEWQVRVS